MSSTNASTSADRPNLEQKADPKSFLAFFGLLFVGVVFTFVSLSSDISQTVQEETTTWVPFILLGIALLIALGFEFVNGFHDTANAVATVIYTNSLPPNIAVVWSGLFNFLGVLFSSGAVAFGIISLLPVELILQVGTGSGFAMVFALLIAAILWNLGTWYFGLPASSSHTLIGSIIGVGIANALMHGRDGTSGVDWEQAAKIGKSLMLSPLIGFGVAALLLLLLRVLVKQPELYQAPQGKTPPPFWIRALLITTCTGVSFMHGSNDGQKGMGLIMLILVGTVPMTYALNRAMPADHMVQFIAVAESTQKSLVAASNGVAAPENPRAVLSDFIRTKDLQPTVVPSLAVLTGDIGKQIKEYGQFNNISSATAVSNVRNDMYLVSETIKHIEKGKKVTFNEETTKYLKDFKSKVDSSTKFIPTWVKVSIAIALGLGTMVGWKRIVVTVGEKIGKSHLTYAQGASAELVAMSCIGAADVFGLPVSTTHVLSSGVAGTMAANGSGLQMSTVRNMAMAWVLTLPAAISLSAFLYWFFVQIF
jgi:PiT family inorganic phosphate transporter